MIYIYYNINSCGVAEDSAEQFMILLLAKIYNMQCCNIVAQENSYNLLAWLLYC